MKLIGAVPVGMVGARLNTPANRAHGERLLGAGPGAATCAGNISRAEHFDIGPSYPVEPAGMPNHRNTGFSPGRKRGMRPNQSRCQLAELTQPGEGIVLAHFIVSDDVERSRRFYTEVLGGRVVFSGEVTYVALANSFIIINVGGARPMTSPRSR
jgi:hypothetical protein